MLHTLSHPGHNERSCSSSSSMARSERLSKEATIPGMQAAYAATLPRGTSSRRLGLAKAKSMRHVRQHSLRKSRDPLSTSGHDHVEEGDFDDLFRSKDNGTNVPDKKKGPPRRSLERTSSSRHHMRSKSKRNLLGASSSHHSKEGKSSSTDGHDHDKGPSLDQRRDRRAMLKKAQSVRPGMMSSKTDHSTLSESSRDDASSRDDGPKGKKTGGTDDHGKGPALEERRDRRAMLRKAQSVRPGMISSKSDHSTLSKSSHDDASSREGRPKVSRRASLTNIAMFKSSSKVDKDSGPEAALTHMMSKPKAMGPYEGVVLIQCDLQVHAGAELVAKHRSMGKKSSNPYIEVWKNLPSDMVGKTKTVSKTLKPSYDESFYMQWDEKALSRCLSKSHQAKITLQIWDDKGMSGREAMGEVTVPIPLPDECPTVNRNWFLVDKDSARNATGRLQITMNVLYVRNERQE